jgi:hypothetical protein
VFTTPKPIHLLLTTCAAAAILGAAPATLAHHSYAMFDQSKKVEVTGTVAKLEWKNPHVFVWVYVPKPDGPGKYDLYVFENGSINVLSRLGWSDTVLKAGDKITIEYYPLRDGRTGGHFDKGTLADGRVLFGAGPLTPDRAPRPELDLPGARQR